MEFIQVLLKKRVELLTQAFGNIPEGEASTRNIVGQITVMSERDKFIEKLKRKQARKQKGKSPSVSIFLIDF